MLLWILLIIVDHRSYRLEHVIGIRGIAPDWFRSDLSARYRFMSIMSPLYIVGLVMEFHLVQYLDLYFLLCECFPWEAYSSSSNV